VPRFFFCDAKGPLTEIDRHSKYVFAAVAGQQILGALTFPISKLGLEWIEPYTFAFFRFTISAIVLLIIARSRTYDTPIERADRLKIVGIGVLIVLLNQTTYLVGQSLTAAGHAALLFATTPLWIYVLARIHLKEAVTVRRSFGIAVAILGVAVVMSQGAVGFGANYLIGDIIVFVSVLAWAYYTILGKPLVRKYGAIRVTAYALASGSVCYLPFGIYRASIFDYGSVPVHMWWTVIYIALGTSVGSYLLWYTALKYWDASRIAVWHNVQPIIAATIAHVFLNEPLGAAFLVGGVIVLGGVLLAEV
jgi:drug/metabolite transporter (DMT)-like permease